MPGNRPQHHHFVPESYLRNFATAESQSTKNKQAYQFDKEQPDRTELPTNIRNLCGQRYLYAPLDNEGLRDFTLEHMFSAGIENVMSPVWASFENEQPNLAGEPLRSHLAIFLATLQLRNPAILALLSKIIDNRNQLYGPMKQEAGKPTYTKDVPAQIGDPVGPDFPVDGNDANRAFVQMIWKYASAMTDTFKQKAWTVLCCDKDLIVTSDRPLVSCSSQGHRAGPGTPGALTLFPLNPNRLLILGDDKVLPSNQYVIAEAKQAAKFSDLLWHDAPRFVISHRPPSEIRERIDSALG